MSDPLKDKRVKDCPDCKVVIMLGEAFTFYCSKHSRFGAIPQRPTKRAPDGLRACVCGETKLTVLGLCASCGRERG